MAPAATKTIGAVRTDPSSRRETRAKANTTAASTARLPSYLPLVWDIFQLCNSGKDASCEGRAIIGRAAVLAIAVRMALSSVHVADPEPLPTALQSREASDQEVRPAHDAKHDRDRAAVLLHPNPQ